MVAVVGLAQAGNNDNVMPEVWTSETGRERRRKPRIVERVKVVDVKVSNCAWCGTNNKLAIVTPRGVIYRCLSCRTESVVTSEEAEIPEAGELGRA